MRNGVAIRIIDVMNVDLAIEPPPWSTPPTAWARTSAVVYDPFVLLGERAGMRALRKDLLRDARGRTVDIGSGTGLNLAHYPDAVDELVVAEPDPSMRARLEQRVERDGRAARVIDAPAERLPFPDGSIDTVVSTLVLCTVDDPELALREIERVLRPDGRLLFIEHVLSDAPRLAAWQHRLAEPWRRFARGCRCDQDTVGLVAATGLTLEQSHEASWRAMPPIVRPLVVGRARRDAR